MKLYLIISSLVLVQGGVVKESDCGGGIVTINHVYYEKEVLIKDLKRPSYLLTTDYNTNTMYFSYSNWIGNHFQGKYENKIVRFDLNTKKLKHIEGVNNGYAQTIDEKTQDVYIGGSDGIYKYNNKTNEAEYIGDIYVNIWSMHFKDVLYYSTFPTQLLYTFVNGTSTRLKDLEDTRVHKFVVGKGNVMFFTNATGLFTQEKGTKKIVFYNDSANVSVRGMATDRNGDVYICLKDGVYALNTATTSFDQVIKVDEAFGLAFDSDNNIVYSDATSLVRLKPIKEKPLNKCLISANQV